jgi:hypothetical protein
MRQGRTQNSGEEQVVSFRSCQVSGVFAVHPGEAPVGVGAIPAAQTGYILQAGQQAANGGQAVKHKIVKRRLKSHFCFVFRNLNFGSFCLLFGQRAAHYHARMGSGRGLLEHAEAALPGNRKGAAAASGLAFAGRAKALSVRKLA